MPEKTISPAFIISLEAIFPTYKDLIARYVQGIVVIRTRL
jgi:hypothetical protein